MKSGIHPQSFPTIFIDTSCGKEFFTMSTAKSDETRKVNGVPYQVIKIEISSASHPFYTGKQMLIDTARRMEKFEERKAKQEKVGAERKGKKVRRAKIQAEKDAAKMAVKKAKKKASEKPEAEA